VKRKRVPPTARIPEKYKSLLWADAVVIADCSNWAIGQPTLITSLRGIVDCVVGARTIDHAVHSGRYGGPVPDALTAMCRAFEAVREHLRSHAPWGAEVTVTRDHQGEPFAIDSSGPAFEAFRRSCADTWDCLPVEAGRSAAAWLSRRGTEVGSPHQAVRVRSKLYRDAR
jgi:acetylornithine deacetylase/succinyl-diaminopimelate desuccinylase-like protein